MFQIFNNVKLLGDKMNKMDKTITTQKIVAKTSFKLLYLKLSKSRSMLWDFTYTKIVGHLRRVKF